MNKKPFNSINFSIQIKDTTMGAVCSRDRKRCLMRGEAFLSVVLFAASMYMFFMAGYFTSNSRKILAFIFGLLGGLILVGAVITIFYAVTIWRDLRDDNVQTTESPERKVRFSSLVEIHEGIEQKPDEEENDQLDHEYEEISPPNLGRQHLAKEQHPNVKFNCQQEKSEEYPCPQLLHLPTEDDEKLQNKNLFHEAYKVYLESKNSYGTFKGSHQNYPEEDKGGLEHENEEEIII